MTGSTAHAVARVGGRLRWAGSTFVNLTSDWGFSVLGASNHLTQRSSISHCGPPRPTNRHGLAVVERR
jgi:hypothetical protein